MYILTKYLDAVFPTCVLMIKGSKRCFFFLLHLPSVAVYGTDKISEAVFECSEREVRLTTLGAHQSWAERRTRSLSFSTARERHAPLACEFSLHFIASVYVHTTCTQRIDRGRDTGGCDLRRRKWYCSFYVGRFGYVSVT